MQEGKSDAEQYPYPSIGLAEIEAAAKRIEGKAHVTPVLTCSTLDELAGRQLFFKCENFQKVLNLKRLASLLPVLTFFSFFQGGAFKFRGACNAVSQLSEEQAKNGVVRNAHLLLMFLGLCIYNHSLGYP